jgi:hypothetical protein
MRLTIREIYFERFVSICLLHCNECGKIIHSVDSANIRHGVCGVQMGIRGSGGSLRRLFSIRPIALKSSTLLLTNQHFVLNEGFPIVCIQLVMARLTEH